MKCPVCTSTDLTMSERSGIEIDYCPQCRGVWLDRGELDKIIERSTQPGQMSQGPGMPPAAAYGHHHDYDRHGHAYPRKKSFWHELFD